MVRTTRFPSLRATRLAACAALALAASVLPVSTQTHVPAAPATRNRAIAPPGALGPLSPRTGLLRKGVVKLRGVVDTERVPGSLDVVSGVIRGATRPDEEIIITAHLDHYKPAPNDNASGSASVLEMVRTLRALIADGRLPPPARTLRFLWVPEYNGTWAWFATHLEDRVTRVANLNFDMLGEDLLTTNAVFNVSYTPDSNPSWLNAVLEPQDPRQRPRRLARQLLPLQHRHAREGRSHAVAPRRVPRTRGVGDRRLCGR